MSLAAAFGPGWDWQRDASHGTTLATHRSGLSVEVTDEAAMTLSGEATAAIGAALRAAVDAGATGQHRVDVSRVGGAYTAVAVKVAQ